MMVPENDVENFNKEFFETPSPSLAYFLGLFAADGCLVKKANGHNQICVSLKSSDSEILKDLHSRLGLRSKLRTYGLKGYRCGFRTDMMFSSDWVGSYLETHGLHPCKSTSLESVEFPAAYPDAFVKGYLDGDGNFDHRQRRRYGKVFYEDRLRFYGAKVFLRWLARIVFNETGVEESSLTIDNPARAWKLYVLGYFNRKTLPKVMSWLGDRGLKRKSMEVQDDGTGE